MPVYSFSPNTSAVDETANAPENPEFQAVAEPTDTEVIAAQSRQYNTALQLWRMYETSSLPDLFSATDEDFDLNRELDAEGIPQEDRHVFEGIKSNDQLNRTLGYYYRDKSDEQLLSSVGTVRKLALGLVAGAMDPLTWIPIGRALKFGTTAVRFAVAGAVYSGLNYSARSAARNEFEVRDLAVDTTVGGIAGSLLYGAGIGVSKGAERISQTEIFKSLKSGFGEMMQTAERWFEVGKDGVIKFCVQGKFGHTTKETVKAGLLWKMINHTPELQMYNSSNPTVKALASKLSMQRVSDLSGTGEPLGITVGEYGVLYEADSLKLTEQVDVLRNQFVKNGGTAEQFNLNVGKTIVNYDMIEMLSGSEVGKASELILNFGEKVISRARKYGAVDEYFGINPVGSEHLVVNKTLAEMPRKDFSAIAIKDEKPNVDDVTAIGHIVRKYNAEKVLEHQDELRELLYRQKKLEDYNVSPEELTAWIDSKMSSLLDANPEPSAPGYETAPFKAWLKSQREIAIHDEVLLDMGVLDYDPVTNHVNALRGVVIDTELNRVSQEMGFQNWTALKESITTVDKQYIGRLAAEGATTKDAKIAAENSKYDRQLLEDVEKLLKGTFGKTGILASHTVANWLVNSRPLIFAMSAGKMALSMIPDYAATVLRAGIGRSFQRLIPFYKAGLDKASKEQLMEFVGFLDSAIRRNRFMDRGYNYYDTAASGSAWIKFSDQVAQKVSKFTLMDWITYHQKSAVAEEIYHKIIHECLQTTPDNKFLNLMGINEKYRQQIAAAWTKYGIRDRRIMYVDPSHFDTSLQNQLRASISTLTNQTILTPNATNVPRFLRTEWGSALTMFSSYVHMLDNDIIKPFLRGDIPNKVFATTVAASVALSALRTMVADYIEGRETDTSSMRFWKETVDYSMLDTYILDYATRAYDVVERRDITMLSAPVNTVNRGITAISSAIRNLYSGRDINWKRFRNVTPGLNFWYVKGAIRFVGEN